MKINSISSAVSSVSGPGTEAHNRSTEVKQMKQAERKENTAIVKAKSQDENQVIHQKQNDEVLEKSIAQANKSLEVHNRHIERVVHEVTHSVMYTIKDTVTDEVIMEFPPKKIQDMIAKMWELAGLFVDEKA